MRYSVNTKEVVTFEAIRPAMEELKLAVDGCKSHPVSVERDGNMVRMKLSEPVLGHDVTTITLDGGLLTRDILENPETTPEDIQKNLLCSLFVAGKTFVMDIIEMGKVSVLKTDEDKPFPNKEQINAQMREFVEQIAHEEIALAYQR